MLRSLGQDEIYICLSWDVAMVMASIQKLTTKHKAHFNSTHTGKSLQGKLEDKLTKLS